MCTPKRLCSALISLCVCVFFLPPTCRSCVAVALCSGFLTRHFLTKSVKSSDQSSGFLNVGGGLVGIMKIAWRNTKRFQKVRRNHKEEEKKKNTRRHCLFFGYLKSNLSTNPCFRAMGLDLSTNFFNKPRLHSLSWDGCQRRGVCPLPSLWT